MIRLLRAVWAVSDAALRLRLQGFATVAGYLDGSGRLPEPAEADRLRREWQSLCRTSRLPWSTCLSRSLALCRIADRRGHRGTIQFGVTRQAPDFLAHAWVVFDTFTLETPPREQLSRVVECP